MLRISVSWPDSETYLYRQRYLVHKHNYTDVHEEICKTRFQIFVDNIA